jgi:hypothetical protein
LAADPSLQKEEWQKVLAVKIRGLDAERILQAASGYGATSLLAGGNAVGRSCLRGHQRLLWRLTVCSGPMKDT